MPLTLEQKKSVVADVIDIAQSASSVAAAEYRGLTVSEITQLREQAKRANVYLRVVPNTLARRALEGTEFACIREHLIGPLILAFSKVEASDSARLLSDFAKTNGKLIVKLAVYSGKLLEGSDVGALASMPARDVALSMLLSVMNAPAAKLVRTLAEPHSQLVRTLGAIRNQKQVA
uniref:Large ribosomal subunit protein uL10 n=1 Tax=Candidatus Kentrum sp. TUN TaxID=2126343 RepID=A0A450ZRJ7_9GAMM|nr:MAG: large subunit ribosomal protein L10 [Candidatus Kentron sp. TUN]VFK56338.1 MAG: large subunit ribosomal protein L10 [Candidatus Kentron sp. TUN]